MLLGVFLIVGLLVAIMELVKAVKQDKELNLITELKAALCPCLPKKKEDPKQEEIPIKEKQNGEDVA